MDNEVFRITLLRLHAAEKARVRWTRLPDILIPPRGPEVIHNPGKTSSLVLFRRNLPAGSFRRCGWRGSSPVGARRRVDKILEFFARFEVGNALRWDFHPRSCLWVAPDARLPLPGAEAAESPNFDFVPRPQGPHDA